MFVTILTILSFCFCNVLPAFAADDNIEYGFCPGSDYPLYLAYINIQPYPVMFEPDELVQIRAHIDLYEPVPEGSKVKVRIAREGGPTPVAIPCINDSKLGPIGSCDYEGNDWLGMLSPFLCPDVSPEECTLPLMNGTYGQDDPYTVTLPDLEQDVDFLLSGTFHVDLTVEREDGTEMTCVYFRIELQQRTTPPPPPPNTTTGPDTCPQCLEAAGNDNLL